MTDIREKKKKGVWNTCLGGCIEREEQISELLYLYFVLVFLSCSTFWIDGWV